MRLAGWILLAALSAAHAAEFPAGQYGAKGDGSTVNTGAIQKAIDAAAKAGGTVVFQPGVYLSGSLFLKSGVELRLDEGVEIRGLQDLAAYPIMPTRVAGIEMKWPAALINVYEQSGVKIAGKGAIDGDGKIWWDQYWKMRREEYEPKGLRWAVDYDCRRPRLIQIYGARLLFAEGDRRRRHHPQQHRRVRPEHRRRRYRFVHGRAGRAYESANVEVAGLTLKRSGFWQKVIIRDSTVRGGAAGVTFGSETSGGIRDVEVYREHVLPSVPNGILFKSASTRGGTIQDISIHDMEMEGVAAVLGITFNWNPSYSYAKIPDGIADVPDYWKVLTEPVAPEKGLPHLHGVKIANIKATGARQAFSVISYADSPLRDFQLQNVEIDAKTAGTTRHQGAA